MPGVSRLQRSGPSRAARGHVVARRTAPYFHVWRVNVGRPPYIGAGQEGRGKVPAASSRPALQAPACVRPAGDRGLYHIHAARASPPLTGGRQRWGPRGVRTATRRDSLADASRVRPAAYASRGHTPHGPRTLTKWCSTTRLETRTKESNMPASVWAH